MVNGRTLWVMYQGFMHLDTETRAAELHWSFLFLVNLAPLCFASDTCILPSDDRFWGNQWISMGSGLAVGFRGCAPLWDEGLRTRLWILQVSLVEIVEPFQESSNWWCSRLLHSVVLSRAFPLLHGSKEALHQVSLEGSLHYFTWFFASYASILSSNEKILGVQWAVGIWGPAPSWDEDLLTRLWMLQESLVDIIETCQESSNWCSMLLHSLVLSRVFHMLRGAKKSFQQVSPHGSLHEITCFFATDTGILSSDDKWQWVFESVLLYEMKAFSPDCWTPQSHVPNTKYQCVSWHCACVSDAQVAA